MAAALSVAGLRRRAGNRAIWMTLLGRCIGLLLGGAVTRYYDRKELRCASTTRHTP